MCVVYQVKGESDEVFLNYGYVELFWWRLREHLLLVSCHCHYVGCQVLLSFVTLDLQA